MRMNRFAWQDLIETSNFKLRKDAYYHALNEDGGVALPHGDVDRRLIRGADSPSGVGISDFTPGYANYLPQYWQYLAGYLNSLPWEQWGHFTGGDFQQWWTANGNNPDVNWGQYGFTYNEQYNQWYSPDYNDTIIIVTWANGYWNIGVAIQ